ncbi:UNVERIFIED_CONTAM: hypothetical protein HDU68_009320 [Siphonaria sp. JEL0065]|nr:hypothetical protein HDU68_009320 [Siphonaria sp. JEL0065]
MNAIHSLYVTARIQCLGAPFILQDEGHMFHCQNGFFDLSEKATLAQQSFLKALHSDLRKFIGSRILPANELPIKILETVVAADLEAIQVDWFQKGLISRDGNPLVMMDSYFEWSPLNSRVDLHNHMQRLSKIQPQLDIILQNLRESISQNVTMNRETVCRLIKFCTQYAASDLSLSPLFIPPYATGKFDMSPLEMEVEQKKLKEAVERVFAGFRKVAHFLQQSYLPRTRTNAGIYGLSGYEKAYQRYIHQYCLSDVSATEIYEIGMSQIPGIQQVMRTILALDDFRGFAAQLRDRESSPTLYESDADVAFEKFKAICVAALENCKRFRFTLMPRTEGFEMCRIMKLDPEFDDEITSPIAFFRQTPLDFADTIQGFVVNVKKLMELPNHQWEAIVLNKLYPGAFLQLESINSIDPGNSFYSFIYKTHTKTSTTHWPTYVESCGQEIGFYQSPLQHFGKLERELINAILLVVDTGLHARNWSIEQSVDFIVSNSAYITQQDALELVLQCCENPGKALAPKMGELRLRDLRERLERVIVLDSLYRDVVTQAMMETEYLLLDHMEQRGSVENGDKNPHGNGLERFVLARVKYWMDLLEASSNA